MAVSEGNFDWNGLISTVGGLGIAYAASQGTQQTAGAVPIKHSIEPNTGTMMMYGLIGIGGLVLILKFVK